MTGSCAARRGSAALSRSSLVALVLGLVLSLAGLSSAQRLCNGFADLCARSYSEVAFAVTHNAYAVGTSIASNQNMPITRQLEDGIRAFKLTVMRNPNGADPNQIRLCHGQCGDNTIFADGGALVDTLATFQKFLAGNPNDVITIFVE